MFANTFEKIEIDFCSEKSRRKNAEEIVFGMEFELSIFEGFFCECFRIFFAALSRTF